MAANKMTLRSVAGCLLILFAEAGYSQIIHPDFQQFNDSFDPVFAVTSDRNGYIWAGTTHGLTRYDSHRSVSYTHDGNNPASLCHNTVNTLLRVEGSGGGVLAGTNRGLCLYDPEHDNFKRLDACGTRHIRALLQHNDSLWVGSSSGLMLLTGYGDGIETGRAEEVINERHIACCCEADGMLYFGSYNKIYQRTADGSVREIDIPFFDRWHSNLICDIVSAGDGEGTLLLGTEYGLVRFNPTTLQTSIEFRDIPVRCFMRCSDGSLWMGTDKGIYVTGADGHRRHIMHESGNASSISDNVVSRIHEDDRGNIWVATDHGICMTMQSGFYNFVRLKSITHSDEGLAIRAMCRDPEGSLWLGGKNGLIRVGRDATTWFKSDGGPADRKISHNKIRSLYADDKGVWIASDGGLDRYEYVTRRFRQFTVTEPTGRYNSSWMYGLCEDRRGRLWISTYEGGVFVVDKKRLLATSGQSYCADMHFSTDDPGFPSNITSKITISNDRCFVATDEGTVSIDTETGEIRPVVLPKGVRAQALDSYGDKVFIGTNTGLYVWHEDSIREIPGPRLPIWVVTAGEERIWTISDAIMSAYDARTRGGGNCQS